MLLAQALCTEASLQALRRAYPQIYDSDEKLLIDPSSISVEQRDFVAALACITPASHRSAAAHARCRDATPACHVMLTHVLWNSPWNSCYGLRSCAGRVAGLSHCAQACKNQH